MLILKAEKIVCLVERKSQVLFVRKENIVEKQKRRFIPIEDVGLVLKLSGSVGVHKML